MFFYAKSTSGFYDAAIHGDAIPADAVEISVETHTALLSAQATGKHIVADASGQPIAIDPPPPSLDDIRVAALSTLPAWESTERAAGLDHASHRWRTTPEALQDIRDALLAGIVPGDVWVDADRAAVPTTLAQLQALWAVCVTRGAEIYQRRLTMEVEIATMTRGQLEVFTPGWPV
ncbi:DUF4376 domain-containing protein [Jeongeupia sp. USM3]|uniref:DUF4376 domain-containing protein n=1 Tax=Jeongeupia sp. USM3 TaxID=1906741 RepID=UPI00089DF61E|nr:DUF4376 domain-containing protein [Jeongeupia sp. USM3]AOY00091.1 hypothetical protein BJP62_06285 [Jeongeupia sp. USM3]